MNRQDVVVVGGGIIGMSCAVELATAGARVTVLEKDKVGMGCSYGNAGWMTPCFAMPLPMPGLFWKSVKWLLDPEGPLYIQPRASLDLARWLTRFAASMTQRQSLEAIEGLVRLSQLSLLKYKELALEFPEIDFHQKGLLMVGMTHEGVQSTHDELSLVERYGVQGKRLLAEELHSMEPALRQGVRGGVYFSQEAHAEPLAIVQALAKKATQLGVQIIEKAEVKSFEKGTSGLKQVVTTKGDFKADVFVLATGSWSSSLASQLGLRLPVLGGKGYAMIMPVLEKQPQFPIMYLEKKIAITPRQTSLRIAGTLELVDQDFSITERRVKAIQKGARGILHLPEELNVLETWAGLRPCTPDGVPLLGATKKYPNFFLACGHQMLGLQSGYGSGKLIADLITTGRSDYDRPIFKADRF